MYVCACTVAQRVPVHMWFVCVGIHICLFVCAHMPLIYAPTNKRAHLNDKAQQHACAHNLLKLSSIIYISINVYRIYLE